VNCKSALILRYRINQYTLYVQRNKVKPPHAGRNRAFLQKIRAVTPNAAHYAIAFFVLAFLVRLVPMGRYVTPDEPIWVLRSARLLDAVITGKWSEVPQTGHPGYTTMVLGACGVQLTKWLHPVTSHEHLAFIRDIAWLAPESSSAFPHLAYFLGTSRLFVALICTAGIVLVYFAGRQRFGERTSRLLALFLALDPFYAGYAGLLHTDALQATFIILSTLYILPKQSDRNKTSVFDSSIAASALFMALAGLTKTLGWLIAPGLALTIILWGGGSIWQRCGRAVLLGLLSAVFFLILFPPFWFDPGHTMLRLLEAVTYHQGAGLRNVFFADQYHVDPGPLFYPAVLVYRLTAPVFVGLISGFWRRKTSRNEMFKWLTIPVIIYVLGLSFATKKFDRYVLSAIPFLSAIASLQWRSYYTRYKRVLLALLCLPWALVMIVPLYYANPLLGGPWLAQHIIPFGWGEGTGFATLRLNEIYADPTERIIQTGDVPGAASLFAGQVQPKQASRAVCADGLISREAPDSSGYQAIEDIAIAGLHITTIHTQTFTLPVGDVLVPGQVAGVDNDNVPPRTTTPELQQWLNRRFRGLPFIWVHAAACDPLTEAQLTALLCPPDTESPTCKCVPAGTIQGVPFDQCQFADLKATPPEYLLRVGDIINIATATWAPRIQAPETIDVHLRWIVNTPYQKLTAYLILNDTDGLVWAEGDTVLESPQNWYKPSRSPGNVLDGQLHLPLQPTLPPGTYTLSLSFSDSDKRGIGVVNSDGTFGGIIANLGSIEVVSSPPGEYDTILPEKLDVTFPGIHIRAASPPAEEILAGDTLPFHLEMARTAHPVDESTAWAILCAGEIAAEGSLFDLPGNPKDWPIDQYYEVRYAPRTAATQPDTECTLVLKSGEQDPIPLSQFHIIARERRFNMPKTPDSVLEYKIGAFGELMGVDIPQTTISTSTTLSLVLYWQGKAAAELNYSVFVHMVGDDGEIWAQSDTQPEGGSAPTATWLAGQVIVDEHYLDIAADLPPGEYTLFTGMYDSESGYRETVYDAEGHRVADDLILIGKITIDD
jgi:hypothetical protein